LWRGANAVVMVGGAEVRDLPAGVERFELEAPDQLSAEMMTWLRQRLRPR
jgi:3-oxoacyl-ACP reductase-like protein